jgi:hypothetical protein
MMKNSKFLKHLPNMLMLRWKKLSAFSLMGFLLMAVPLFSWQCKEDDFTGEITGLCPEVVTTTPINTAVNVTTNHIITATFNVAMNPETVNTNSFKINTNGVPVPGVVTYSALTASFTPANLLANNTLYTATVTRNVKDLMGNMMVKDTTWTFRTVAAIIPIMQYTVTLSASPADAGTTSGAGLFDSGSLVTVNATAGAGFTFEKWTENAVQVSTSASYGFGISANRNLVASFAVIVSGPQGINLGSAANFAVLAGSGVSNTGVTTLITGDVGSFPTATMNGLLSSHVNGLLYTVADPVVGTAKTDLTTAYNDAQSRSTDAISLPGQLGGLTLAPGLYVNSTSSGISGTGSNAILTLDAQGNPNATWIFKMGSTFITDAGTSIVLAGGAKAKNIYWSVGTSATLGTNSVFYGNILADQSITLTTGARLTGRALTRIGQVTLDNNTVTKP